jgi:hypothetical protein
VTQQRLSSDDDEPEPPVSGEAPRDGLRLPWDRRWRSR